jgi:molybdate transport system substrate-binding protein
MGLSTSVRVVKRVFRLSLFAVLVITGCVEEKNKDEAIIVFAAASLRDVMKDIATNYEQSTGDSIVFNFAGSNVLAQQIEASAQADIYLSANVQWMDYLMSRSLVAPQSKKVFLSNSLVFIANKRSQLVLNAPQDLSSLSFRFLSLGNPEAVPAGRYAKEYLSAYPLDAAQASVQTLNEPLKKMKTLWSSVENKILPAPNVKAATSMVESMPDILGIVYKTDALASDKVKILFEVQSHENAYTPRVQYFAARVEKSFSGKDKSDDGKDMRELHAARVNSFLKYLMEEEAREVFKAHGFNTDIH